MSVNEIFNKVGTESKKFQNEKKKKEKILEYNSHIYNEIKRKIGREFIQGLPKFFLENHVEPNYICKINFFNTIRGWVLEIHDDGERDIRCIVTTKSIYYITNPYFIELRRKDMVTVDQLIDCLNMFRAGIDQDYLSSQIRTETEIRNIIESNIEVFLKNIIKGKVSEYDSWGRWKGYY